MLILKRSKIILGIGIVAILLSGCSSKSPQPDVRNDKFLKNIIAKEKEKEKLNEARLFATNPYQLRIKPIVGTEQDDSKVVVDMGKILKIWVAPYVVHNTLIAAHDIYTWVQAPRFIAGESLPTPNQVTGLVTADHNYPIVFRPVELDNKKATFKDEELKRYVNEVYKVAKHPSIAKKRIKKTYDDADKVIKDFIEGK